MRTTIGFFGAAGTVTGSSYLLESPRGRLLIDCGMFQGPHALKELNYGPFPFDPQVIDAVLVTHAHIDHSGLLPKLTKAGYRGPIWTTAGTADLLTWMLPDSAHIQEFEVEQLNRRQRRRAKDDVEPIYTAADADACLKQIKAIEFDQWQEVLPQVKARWWNAGHILGAGSIELVLEDGKDTTTMLFSGDVGPRDSALQSPAEAPSGVDYLIVESTYGDRARPRLTDDGRRAVLEKEVKDALARGGNLIIPAFAIERSQELLADLAWLILRNRLPKVPIFVDSPLAVRATEVFERHRGTLDGIDQGISPFRATNLRYIETVEESQKLNHIVGGAIIISASGMCDAGRVRHHLKHHLWRPNATVLLVGYQAPGTLGYLLENGAAQVSIQGEHITVKATIRRIEAYSGHADRDDLRSWIKDRLPIRRNAFLVHGEESALQAQQEALIGMGLSADQVIIPALDQRFTLDPQKGAILIEGERRRLSSEKAEEARRGWDWTNDLAALNLDLKGYLQGLPNDKDRQQTLREFRRLMERHARG
ncbi:MAG TPA: MBL fold metallo-hydrolase [Terriglobia bacterium]|nr:MBL fold metallo-hydrolase [Terriglobia bacterium]